MGRDQLKSSRCEGLYTLRMGTGHLALCALVRVVSLLIVETLMCYLHTFVPTF